MVQRYYSNNTGRFFSPDPAGRRSASLTNPTASNRYAYAVGDPVNSSDPSGMLPKCNDMSFEENTPCTDENVQETSGGNGPCGGMQMVYFQEDNPTPFLGDCLLGDASGTDAEGGGGGGTVTSVTNIEHLSTNLFGDLANALSGTDCGKWFQAGLTTSGQGLAGETLSNYLANDLPNATGSGDFVGGSANALTTNAYAGYQILFNNAGAFFNSLPAGQSIGYSNDYTSQFAAIQGGSPEAQAFLLLHELAHVFDMIRPNDSNSAANQAFNNDEVWLNCSSVIQSFPNQKP